MALFLDLKRSGRFVLVAFAALMMGPSSASADVINVDVSGVAPQFRGLFTGAEAFWETRIQNWSEDLPVGLRRNLQSLQITAVTGQIDGVGGAVGGAAVTSTANWTTNSFFGQRNYAVPQTAFMQFDLADLSGFDPTDPFSLTLDDFRDTIIHEMGHAMGLGSLWVDNGFLGTAINGQTEYTHTNYALDNYRTEAGNRRASFVPIEQAGGPGTALSHWSSLDPFFNQLDTTGRTETMLGFIFNQNSNGDLLNGADFVSETSWGAHADMGWEVAGINDNKFNDDFGRPPFPKEYGGGGPIFFKDLTNVPEPGSAIALLAMGFVVGFRRRK